MVEIYETREQRELATDSSKRIFRVYIIGRVKVRRETISKERVKPYSARSATDREVPADADADRTSSVSGTESPDLPQSTHTVATEASSSKNIISQSTAAAEDLSNGDCTVGENPNNVPPRGNLKRSLTEFPRPSWGVDLGLKKGIEWTKKIIKL